VSKKDFSITAGTDRQRVKAVCCS